MKCTCKLSVGDKVNVTANPNDIFLSFSGEVKEINDEYVVVEAPSGCQHSVSIDKISLEWHVPPAVCLRLVVGIETAIVCQALEEAVSLYENAPAHLKVAEPFLGVARRFQIN